MNKSDLKWQLSQLVGTDPPVIEPFVVVVMDLIQDDKKRFSQKRLLSILESVSNGANGRLTLRLLLDHRLKKDEQAIWRSLDDQAASFIPSDIWGRILLSITERLAAITSDHQGRISAKMVIDKLYSRD